MSASASLKDISLFGISVVVSEGDVPEGATPKSASAEWIETSPIVLVSIESRTDLFTLTVFDDLNEIVIFLE